MLTPNDVVRAIAATGLEWAAREDIAKFCPAKPKLISNHLSKLASYGRLDRRFVVVRDERNPRIPGRRRTLYRLNLMREA